jgi:hypothetical protein
MKVVAVGQFHQCPLSALYGHELSATFMQYRGKSSMRPMKIAPRA